jgi:hypothetical protein
VSLPEISVKNAVAINGITIEPLMSPQKLLEKLTLLCPSKQETAQNQAENGENKVSEQNEDGDTKKESNADTEVIDSAADKTDEFNQHEQF